MSTTYTREQVSAALNAAANLLDDQAGYESSETIRDQDRANLLVNAAGHLLDHPGASLDDVILANYKLDLGEDDGETVAAVKGWIA